MIRTEWSITALEARPSPVGKRSGIIRFVSVATPVGTSARAAWTSRPSARARSSRVTPPGGVGREHRAADVERQVQLCVRADRRRIRGPDRPAGPSLPRPARQHHEPERPRDHEPARGRRSSSVRADPRAAPARGSASVTSGATNASPTSAAHGVRNTSCASGGIGSEPLSLRPRGRGRVAGVLVALPLCGWSSRRDGPGSSRAAPWPRAGPRDRASPWRCRILAHRPRESGERVPQLALALWPALEAASARTTPSTTSTLALSGPLRSDAAEPPEGLDRLESRPGLWVGRPFDHSARPARYFP